MVRCPGCLLKQGERRQNLGQAGLVPGLARLPPRRRCQAVEAEQCARRRIGVHRIEHDRPIPAGQQLDQIHAAGAAIDQIDRRIDVIALGKTFDRPDTQTFVAEQDVAHADDDDGRRVVAYWACWACWRRHLNHRVAG